MSQLDGADDTSSSADSGMRSKERESAVDRIQGAAQWAKAVK